jgi:ferredoxin
MQITLEGHGAPVPAKAGDTILQSLLRAGVPFPFSCQGGNCGTCKCELVSGSACRAQACDDAVVRRIDEQKAMG